MTLKMQSPVATATIEALGVPTRAARRHLIKVALRVSGMDSKYADKEYLADLARRALACFPCASGEPDRRLLTDMSAPSSYTKPVSGGPGLTGVECSTVWPERPDADSLGRLRAVLLAEGYRVAVQEKRVCCEPSCTTEAMLGWPRLSEVPTCWYSNLICGLHNYRACAKCSSTYIMTSASAVGQAPSVRCEVCGEILVAWGSSKTWSVKRVAIRREGEDGGVL
jgi:hypothetical protein